MAKLRLFPREEHFFDLLECGSDVIYRGACLFRDMVEDFSSPAESARKIKDAEHEADEITHETMRRLYRTFVTPIDREDIHNMVTRMDDILDGIDAAAKRLVIFKVRDTDRLHLLRQMAGALVRGAEIMARAVRGLRNLKNADSILEDCVRIHEVENESDELMRKAFEELFQNSRDPLEVIKWKEIYELAERATDRIEDVANVIEGIVIKNA